MPADPRPPSSRKRPSPAEDREAFKVNVLAIDGGRLIHDDEDDCDGPLQVHHVLTQAFLRKAGLHDLLWSSANGMAICERAHARHTTAIERIPLSRVPERAKRFAADLGFAHVLSRYYPSD